MTVLKAPIVPEMPLTFFALVLLFILIFTMIDSIANMVIFATFTFWTFQLRLLNYNIIAVDR